jgi:hypothetical protein
MDVDIDITNFNAGELSPRLMGRHDVQRYFSGCREMLNMVTMPFGGATRRPGTRFARHCADQTAAPMLVPFIFRTDQAYVLEFSHLKVRVFARGGVVLDGGSPVEFVAPWARTDLRALWWWQSADTLFVGCPGHQPQQITRTSDTAWTITPIAFRDGPYHNINVTPTTLSFNGTHGDITVTASGTTGINGGAGFQANDVGRHVRVRQSGLWAWMIVKTWVSSTQVVCTVQSKVPDGAWEALDGDPYNNQYDYRTYAILKNGANYYQALTGGRSGGDSPVHVLGEGGTYNIPEERLESVTAPNATASEGVRDGAIVWKYVKASSLTGATTAWQLGKWRLGNWPTKGMFWQNRMVLAGSTDQPNSVDCSVIGDFTNFAPSQSDSSVTAVNALAWTIDDNEVNVINWLSPSGSVQAMQLGIGTTGGEQILQGASASGAVTPTSVQAYQETRIGSRKNVRPVRIGSATLFANRPGSRLHEWSFDWRSNGYQAPDLTVLADHIAKGPNGEGIEQMAYQQTPYSILWCVRGDGALVGMTYLREQDSVGWHRHQLGGEYYRAAPRVESLACIPSTDGTYDELWLAVVRTFGTTVTRTIEVMTRWYDVTTEEQTFFVDCGLARQPTYPTGTTLIGGLTNTAPPTKTPALVGPAVLLSTDPQFGVDVIGKIARVRNGQMSVFERTSAYEIGCVTLRPLLSGAPVTAGEWTLDGLVTSLGGLNHLAGETVHIEGDGQALGTAVVSGGGTISFPAPGASRVVAGLHAPAILVPVPIEPIRAVARQVTGRIQRVTGLWIRFDQTVGGKFGVRVTDPDTQAEIDTIEGTLTRTSLDAVNAAVPPRSGIRGLRPPGGHGREVSPVIMQDQPLPITILAIAATATVGTA